MFEHLFYLFVQATFPVVVWWMEGTFGPSYADKGRLLPAPWWEAWCAYANDHKERVVVE